MEIAAAEFREFRFASIPHVAFGMCTIVDTSNIPFEPTAFECGPTNLKFENFDNVAFPNGHAAALIKPMERINREKHKNRRISACSYRGEINCCWFLPAGSGLRVVANLYQDFISVWLIFRWPFRCLVREILFGHSCILRLVRSRIKVALYEILLSFSANSLIKLAEINHLCKCKRRVSVINLQITTEHRMCYPSLNLPAYVEKPTYIFYNGNSIDPNKR